MTVIEILTTNKNKYNRSLLITNNINSNAPSFEEVYQNNLDDDLAFVEAKDYFLLEKEGFEEVFGKSHGVDIQENDKILLIGI
ncbi:hypothetical protein [uncultured Helcococcus sp.]|uniref:hypothetical protein n=1 Tax=uncultured Helcococcus sp. TaxID=1072508 RepID=UPI002629C75C|nr:hypothetical protein [uncultured Helcococcus sp.]